MTDIQTVLLYACVIVNALWLVTGGYKVVRNFIQSKIDAAAAEQIKLAKIVNAVHTAPVIDTNAQSDLPGTTVTGPVSQTTTGTQA